MRWYLRHLGAALTAVVALPVMAQQQQVQRDPRIGYVLPAGGQRGTTFTVTVGGQYLDGTTGAFFTGKGIKAKVVDSFIPTNPGQAALLRNRMDELRTKRQAANGVPTRGATTEPSTRPVFTAEDEKEFNEIVKRLANFVRKPSSPAISESVTLSVEIEADAEPGEREIRLVTPRRDTNPMVFFVGQLPEVCEKPSRLRDEPTKSVPPDDANVTLPTVVNGQIMPGGVDRYHFTARKGQNLVVIAKARALVPYIADAVPGWFQATIRLLDKEGKELAYDDDYRFDPDPVLHYVIPADGQYLIEIHDSIYRGREDFVYRIAMGELPFVTSIFPLGGKAGAKTDVVLTGWNLPDSHFAVDGQPAGIAHVALPDRGLYRDSAVFAADALPEVMEQVAHDSPQTAQGIAMPVIINGRITKSDEVDVYSFRGRAGEEIVAEVRARRLDSPLDSVLILTDAAGKQIAMNDDQEDKGAGLETHHADSYILTKLPADGVYYLTLRDTQGKGGPEYAYRLRISQPRPSFELRVTPSSASLRGWNNTPLSAQVIRRDGFTGEVAVSLDGSPGFDMPDVRIPADKTEAKLNIAPRRSQADGIYPVRIVGRATIAGKQVVHPAVPAEDMMQAFAYRHLVPADELLVTVARFVAPPTRPALGLAAARKGATTKPSKRGE